MNKCKLCENNIADKLGSHVIPHFLLKRIFNIPEDNKRDKEISFMIGSIVKQAAIGRSVNPERLNEVFGEITEEQLSSLKKPLLVVDNFFCTHCENRLANIESLYAPTLNIESKENYESKIESSCSSLFWFSVVWRYSLIGQLKLKGQAQNILRKILDQFLPKDSNHIDCVLLTEVILKNKIQYTLLRSPNINKQKGTLIFHHTSEYSPYFIMIDEFIIGIKIHTNINNKLFLGVEDFFNSEFDNNNKGKEIIRIISDQQYIQAIEQTLVFMSRRSLKAIIKIIDKLYKKITTHNFRMPNELKIRILENIIYDAIPMGQKYTIEHILRHTQDVLIKRN